MCVFLCVHVCRGNVISMETVNETMSTNCTQPRLDILKYAQFNNSNTPCKHSNSI